jgi:hypothetical protein
MRPPRSDVLTKWLKPLASNCQRPRASTESERLARSGLRNVVAAARPSPSAKIKV